jgi:hypothetical protein
MDPKNPTKKAIVKKIVPTIHNKDYYRSKIFRISLQENIQHKKNNREKINMEENTHE